MELTGGFSIHQCAQLRTGRDDSPWIKGKKSSVVIPPPGFSVTGVRDSGKAIQPSPPSPEMGEVPKGHAAAAEQGGVNQLPSDQSGKEPEIGECDLFAAEPGSLLHEAAFQLIECFEQAGFGTVVSRLVARESAAVDAVIDEGLQQSLPVFDGLSLIRWVEIASLLI